MPVAHKYIKSIAFNIICVLTWLQSGENVFVKICRNETEEQKKKFDNEYFYFAFYVLEENGRRIKKDSRYQFRPKFMKRLEQYFKLFP